MDGMITKEDLKNRYVFWDIDGTLAAYRVNNHLACPDDTVNLASLTEINDGIFLSRKPSKLMQRVVNTCGAKRQIIMGHCISQKEIEDKHIWLNKYYPTIKERLLVSVNNSKADTIIKYCKENNISLSDVVFVDDVLSYLKEAEKKGIKSWHISSFLDWLM
jgi:FMN phosphatase YigB (HAD superfamily)